jgi:hypothetical protein
MGKSSGALAIVVFAGLLTLHLFGAPAFAQAGSTGGTVGKTDKSASGGSEEPARHNAKPRAAKRESSRPTRETGSLAIFNGSWTGTASGRCILTWQITLQVDNGVISGTGASGQITRGGYGSGALVVFGVKFDVLGHFGAKEASGTFKGPDGCPGQWTLTKT